MADEPLMYETAVPGASGGADGGVDCDAGARDFVFDDGRMCGDRAGAGIS